MRQADKCGIMKFSTVTPLLILIFTQSAFAGLYRMESESFVSGRNGYFDQKFETPMYELLSGSYESTNKRLSMNTNLSLFADPSRLKTDPSQKDAHLYTGDLNYEVIEDLLKIRVGRSFDTHYSIGANSMDAVAAEFSFFDKQLHFGGFFGIERKPEHQDYETNNTIGGANVRFTQDDMYPWTLNGKLQQRFFQKEVGKKDERLTELAVAKPFNLSWSPTVLAESTWNVDDLHWDRFDFSTDVYPGFISLMRFRATSIEIRKNIYPEPATFSIFSAGRLYEGLLQFENQFNNQFIASISGAYDDYQGAFNQRTHGCRTELETRYTPSVYGITNVAYFFTSYGGTAYGDRLRLSKKLNFDNEVYTEGELTHYDKITGANRYASHLEAGLNHWFANRFKLVSFGEYNNNNILQYDVRAGIKLTYLIWTETR